MVYWESIDKRIPLYNDDDQDNNAKNKQFHRIIRNTAAIIFALFFGK